MISGILRVSFLMNMIGDEEDRGFKVKNDFSVFENGLNRALPVKLQAHNHFH
jgi:hypothetical protein